MWKLRDIDHQKRLSMINIIWIQREKEGREKEIGNWEKEYLKG